MMEEKEKKNKRNALILLVSLFVYAFILVFVFYEGGNAFESNSGFQNLEREKKNHSSFQFVSNEEAKDWEAIDLVKNEKSAKPLRITKSELNRMTDLLGQFAEMLPQKNTANFAFRSMDYETQVGLINFAQGLEYREIEELEEFIIAVDNESFEVYAEGAEVAGAQDPVSEEVENIISKLRDFLVGTCEDSAYEIVDPQLFCGAEGLSGSEEIKIAQIWSVDIKSVGSATGFDNLLLTHNPRGLTAWRNDSDAIMEEFDYDVKMPPNESLRDSVKLSEDERFEHYEMHYEAAGVLNEIPYDVHPEEKSLCPDILNPGHFNVKGSNNLEKELTDTISPPGLMTLGNRSLPVNLCEEPFFREDFDEDDTFLLCNEGFFDILKCTFQNILRFRDTCPEIGGVFVDATLGSGQICNEEDCSSRYWEAGRELASPPTWMEQIHHPSMTKEEKENDYSSNHPDETVIFTTPCYLRIDCEICTTKCFWDVSMLKHIFEQESKYTYPGFKNAPEVEDYLRAIVDEIKYRGRFGSRNY